MPTIIRPTLQQLLQTVGESQDGKKISMRDEYGKFLYTLITQNVIRNAADPDCGNVDVDELESNLKYAIHEFSKALKAIQTFIP